MASKEKFEEENFMDDLLENVVKELKDEISEEAKSKVFSVLVNELRDNREIIVKEAMESLIGDFVEDGESMFREKVAKTVESKAPRIKSSIMKQIKEERI